MLTMSHGCIDPHWHSHNVQWLHWLPLALMVTDEMYGSGRPLLAHGNNPAAL